MADKKSGHLTKWILRGLTLLSLCACVHWQPPSASDTTSSKENWNIPGDLSANFDACVLIYNVQKNTFEKKHGEAQCQQGHSPESTFDLVLAIVGLQTQKLKDETTILGWNGQERAVASWNRDHNARGWMQESVDWYSQNLAQKIGLVALKKFVKKISYGNQKLINQEDWWSASPLRPGSRDGQLKITAYEQLDFLKRITSHQIPLNKESYQTLHRITHLQDPPEGYVVWAKTGSGFKDQGKIRHGWFLGRIKKENSEGEYLMVVHLKDKKEESPEGPLFMGERAKELAFQMLLNHRR